jgi:hypothetical protein
MSNKKVWFITGAGRGMGVDITKAALAVGHKVYPIEFPRRIFIASLILADAYNFKRFYFLMMPCRSQSGT